MILPDPDVPDVVYSNHYVLQGRQDWEDELPPETMGRMKKQKKGKSNLHAGANFAEKLESMNLDPSLSKLIQKYHEGFGTLPPAVSCKRVVQVDPKRKPELEGSVVTRRPYPAPQDQIDEIERQIQECIDAGLVEEYKHVDYPRHCIPCFLVAKPGSNSICLVVDYGEINKKTRNHSRSTPNMENTLERLISVDSRPGWTSAMDSGRYT